jgi:carotenoid cleavage dioxygenase-like enzyme
LIKGALFSRASAPVISDAYDSPGDVSSLVILDARHLASEPIAVVRLPRRVPVGIHGVWLAGY